MILDQQQIFSDAQVITATANSTNIIDVLGKRDLGAGEQLRCVMQIKDNSTAVPTFTAALVGADDSGFSTNKITIGSITPTLTVGGAQLAHIGIPAHAGKRFFRIEYTITGGTSPSQTVTAGFAHTEQNSAMTV